MILGVDQRINTGSTSVRLGLPLAPSALANIERHLHLNCNKWDTQIGDSSVLSAHALILAGHEWDWLCNCAEQLAAEMTYAESIALETERYCALAGVPAPVRRLLGTEQNQAKPNVAVTRSMRFDFHPTSTGWRVSEVNSDVPGGWTEATELPNLYASFHPGMEIPASPLDAWTDSMRSVAAGGGVALLAAPGFLEDQQVVLAFMRRLHGERISSTLIQSPSALDWSSKGIRRIRGSQQRVSAVVRFYQIEWLCNLSNNSGWRNLLQTAELAVTNPTISVLSESKRFPLVINDISGCTAWKTLMPECRDPRDVDTSDWDGWALKAAYSNTGDEVYLCGDMDRAERQQLILKVRRNPTKWIAQRRFDTIPLYSDEGLLYPCIGVFVVDGRAAGAYVRLSKRQVTDGSSKEAPLFIDRTDFAK